MTLARAGRPSGVVTDSIHVSSWPGVSCERNVCHFSKRRLSGSGRFTVTSSVCSSPFFM